MSPPSRENMPDLCPSIRSESPHPHTPTGTPSNSSHPSSGGLQVSRRKRALPHRQKGRQKLQPPVLSRVTVSPALATEWAACPAILPVPSSEFLYELRRRQEVGWAGRGADCGSRSGNGCVIVGFWIIRVAVLRKPVATAGHVSLCAFACSTGLYASR